MFGVAATIQQSLPTLVASSGSTNNSSSNSKTGPQQRLALEDPVEKDMSTSSDTSPQEHNMVLLSRAYAGVMLFENHHTSSF